MINRLWAWITGYVIIKMKGAQLEALINRIAGHGFGIWDLERVTANIMIGKIRIRQFKRLRPLLGGLNVRVGIVGRAGLPFFLAKLMKRNGLIVGLLLVIGCLYYLTGFVWVIEITGMEKLSADQIAAVLADQGIKVGAAKAQIRPNYLENLLLTQFPELSWAGVSLKGVLMQVAVAEQASPDLAEVQYGDMVAADSGLVTQVVPFRGTALVSAGSTVKKGDVLISGEYYDQYGRWQKGSAEGIVRARVWYDAFGEAAFSKVTEVATGNYHTVYTLTLGKWKVRLGRRVPFTDHTNTVQVWQVRIGSLKLPIAVARQTYAEVEYHTVLVAPEQARALALERAWQQLAATGVERDQVMESQVDEYIIADQHGIRVGLIAEVEQNIARFVPRP
ncbi:MAG: sporulation protein YqfD [Firmicutes bacterium]|jgi:similar to stage IV sporulation protein|nr:sporulation protein YqfD [Bacillota bacterium]NLL88364.1 sporulation protein YqfD [Bacillota bacterium]